MKKEKNGLTAILCLPFTLQFHLFNHSYTVIVFVVNFVAGWLHRSTMYWEHERKQQFIFIPHFRIANVVLIALVGMAAPDPVHTLTLPTTILPAIF